MQSVCEISYIIDIKNIPCIRFILFTPASSPCSIFYIRVFMGKYFLGSLFFVPSLYSAELVCGRIHFKIFIGCGNVRFGNSLGLFFTIRYHIARGWEGRQRMPPVFANSCTYLAQIMLIPSIRRYPLP